MTLRRTIIVPGVLLLGGVAVAVAGFFILHLRSSYRAPLVISVQARYPGADAPTVRDTVAAPIEQQVSGVEGALALDSQAANDGTYTLLITFKRGTDLQMAQVLVENRVSLALPVLPQLVQQEGISVRKRSPEPLVLVSLTSPDNRHDGLYLSNYVTIQLKDELARVPGVSDVVLFGQRDPRLRVVLDADKLAALQVSAMEVAAAISAQNTPVPRKLGQPAAPKDQEFQLTINTLGRLTGLEQLESIIVKAVPGAGIVRLKDVARVEPDRNERSSARLNGQPAVVLAIHPLSDASPRDVSRAVDDRLALLRARLPDGLALAAAFDFAPNLVEANRRATPERLVIDVELPEGASAERTVATLEQAADVVRKTPGVQDVLTLTEHPFSLVRNRPCLVVSLDPKDQRDAHPSSLGREAVAGRLRRALRERIRDAVFRLSLPSAAAGFPVYGFPIDIAIEDRGNLGHSVLRQRADALVEKMSQSGKFSDAGCSGMRSAPCLSLEIDRTRCLALGVAINDVFNTLQVYLGSYHVNDFNQFGRTWQVNVQVSPEFLRRAADLPKLQVKNQQNQLVQLGTLLTVRDQLRPQAIERHNLYPIARITANLAEGVPLAEAKSLCQTLSEQELDGQFHVSWRIR